MLHERSHSPRYSFLKWIPILGLIYDAPKSRNLWWLYHTFISLGIPMAIIARYVFEILGITKALR